MIVVLTNNDLQFFVFDVIAYLSMSQTSRSTTAATKSNNTQHTDSLSIV